MELHSVLAITTKWSEAVCLVHSLAVCLSDYVLGVSYLDIRLLLLAINTLSRVATQ
jgi:hypothetical protein